MSVFRNVGVKDPPIQGVDYDGQPITVGVALGLDDEIRLALRGGIDSEVILSHSEAERLITRLKTAV